MTLLSERENARTDLVAASHSLRLLIVTITIPFALQWSGLQGLDILIPTVRDVSWPGLALLALLTGAGALVMDRLGRANPWFMGRCWCPWRSPWRGCICRQCRKRWSMPRSW